MIEAVIYHPNGKIEQTLSCKDIAELEANVPEGWGYLLGGANCSTQYVKNGEIVDYPEKPGVWAIFDFESHVWIDPRTTADLEAAANAQLQNKRAGMSISRMQGILALGAEKWNVVLQYRYSEQATFAEQIIIDQASVWNRLSENIAFFAYLLNLSDEEVDELFELATTIEA